MDNIIEENKRLIKEYPFLIPRNRWTGKIVVDYDYSYTELDAMPDGWRIAFGESMCKEIKEALIKEQKEPEYTEEELNELIEYYGLEENTPKDLLHIFEIVQIKEKYGSLRFYTNFSTEEIKSIIKKYEDISARTCIKCGKPATKISLGWICPWCDDCVDKKSDRFVTIDEYFK